MDDKQLTIEDVIKQLHGVINTPDPRVTGTKKLLINASQMAVVRQMMDAGSLANNPMTKREVYEPEETNEVPKVR